MNALVTVSLVVLLATACGGDADETSTDGPGDDPTSDGGDAGNTDDMSGDDETGDGDIDASVQVPCTPQASYGCGNCIDDDLDGLIDGQDPECQGRQDRREDSFATLIPGDNVDPKQQDCYFDGKSTPDCQVHTCCLLADGACPASLQPFNRAQDCTNLGAPCLTECLAVTPVGCDCYGCCTVCDPDTDECADILLQGAPTDCHPDDIGTDTASECMSCVKVEECSGGECNASADDCVLCPGQTARDLPDACTANVCPEGSAVCRSSNQCETGDYCSHGCCRAGDVE